MKLPHRTSITQFDDETRSKLFKLMTATEAPLREEVRRQYNTTMNVLNEILSWGIDKSKVEEKKRVEDVNRELATMPHAELQNRINQWTFRKILTVGDVNIRRGMMYDKNWKKIEL